MKNVMFSDAPLPRHKSGAFDLSNEVKMSGHIGMIYPFMWHDIVPGDRFRIRSHLNVKMASFLSPLMHFIDVYVHYFFVPYRIIWERYATEGGATEFFTGDESGTYTSVMPYVTISNATKAYFAEGTLADYLGLPVIANSTTVTQDIDINVLPFYAYRKIFNDYYRDENLEDEAFVSPGASATAVQARGGDQSALIAYVCANPNYRHHEKDYLRGALPTAYTGASSDVELDLDIVEGLTYMKLELQAGGGPTAGAISVTAGGTVQDSNTDNLQLAETGGILDNYNAVIEAMELRRMMAITRSLEAERRGGIRYIEMLLGKWGVISDNRQLDYPEYLGGGRQAVNVTTTMNASQVLDPTAGVNDGVGGVPVTVDPQSYETGRGIAAGKTNYATLYAKEHGIIMGLISVLPRSGYGGAQLERFWTKMDREDFFDPYLQNIGDQAIYQHEVGYDATGTDATNVFGYAPRWSEYKFKNNTVHGEFLSTLDFWHMNTIGDTSAAGPDLNAAWTRCTPVDDECTRIFADTTWSDKIYFQIFNDVRAIRPMLVHDIPR